MQAILKYFKTHTVLFHFFAAVLWIWGLSLLLVIFWGLMISFRDGTEYSLDPTRLFPREFVFSNYVGATRELSYNNSNYVAMIWNSVWYSTGSTLMRLAATTMSAYVVAKYRFRGRKLFYGVILIQMMLPTYGQATANYNLLDKLGLLNTPLILLSQGAGHGMYFLIMHSYFENLPSAFIDAAKVDGGGNMRIFLQIMAPLAKSCIIAIFLITFIANWNDYMTPILYLDSYPTLASGLYRYKIVAAYHLDTPTYFAGVFMAALPIATLFIVFNKVLMENLTIGGIKG